ncbi:MAG: hypothetical protein K5669_06510 [Lachnospiraceae bacterium]|nr:hypothetical protein [Lachnospiraceae bacterium]
MNFATIRKNLIRIVVLIVVFIATLIVASRILNRDIDNITMDLEPATLPVIDMVRGDFLYNKLYGYTGKRDVTETAENLTVLGDERNLSFRVKTYGNEYESILYEVRSSNGERLIEFGEVEDIKKSGYYLTANLSFKDLLTKDVYYSLELTFNGPEDKSVYFYTNIVWGDDLGADDKLSFAEYFHDKLFDKENASEIRKYIETNSSLNDNSTFASVDIHSSLDQITYGDLKVTQTGEPDIAIKEISEQMAEITIDYFAFSGDDENKIYYRLTEYFRVKTGKERMLLIDYQRTMEQVPDEDSLCVNDKIVLGIADRGVNYSESEDGNTVAFVYGGRLYSYQSKENKLTRVFSFSGNEEFDERAIHSAHDIKILDIEESGTIKFAVYGYMNSGRHEGEVGIEVYSFDGKLNTIEELIYLPYERSWGTLKAELNTLLYLNREEHLFLALENKVYCVDLKSRKYTVRNDLGGDDTLVTSADHRILISRSAYEESQLSKSITLTNLKSEKDKEIAATEGDCIRSLGFIGPDVIYGMAHIENIRRESSGRLFFPMYSIVICDEEGNLIKKYEYDGYYVVSVELNDNQLTLKRVSIDEKGKIKDEKPDYITAEDVTGGVNVTDATAVVDTYKTYVQLQLPGEVDSDLLKVASPKEVVYEGGRDLALEIEKIDRYTVYDAYGVADIFNLASNAIELANVKAGWVCDQNGDILWKRTPRSTKNQIMAIEAEGCETDESPLAVCLDAMLANEGIIRNSQYLLDEGSSVLQILGDNMENCKILDLTDCELDMMLYYVNIETPVLVMTGDEDALLIVGYNDTNSYIVALDPKKGSLEKMAYDDAAELFKDYGNNFITYIKMQ